ncbi:hypothetical protein Bca52824_067002 [Brassica carinata]|uniref:Uncharacterized protein n=1 Tax=Brassica carinata TaxID=52824 RepID=A0A8X7UBA9_BRACI|nr:hypothetical protein Bca52824_067002 [Brassica carinata]
MFEIKKTNQEKNEKRSEISRHPLGPSHYKQVLSQCTSAENHDRSCSPGISSHQTQPDYQLYPLCYLWPELLIAFVNAGNEGSVGAQKLIFAPLDLVKKPFQRRDTVFPVDGVSSLCQLVHRVLQSQEEACFQELAKERLLVELARSRAVDGSQGKPSSMSAAAVGASLGAGLGLVLAVVMGAGSALRKP